MIKHTEDHLIKLKFDYYIRQTLEELKKILNTHDKKLDQITTIIEKLESSMSRK